jgi:hypothetical protein
LLARVLFGYKGRVQVFRAFKNGSFFKALLGYIKVMAIQLIANKLPVVFKGSNAGAIVGNMFLKVLFVNCFFGQESAFIKKTKSKCKAVFFRLLKQRYLFPNSSFINRKLFSQIEYWQDLHARPFYSIK